ncbi:MAG TPA: DNA methyltransferase [Pseudomonadales bacterium]|nr:DNA methyltransferase [Pseudomonadales bacterium]
MQTIDIGKITIKSHQRAIRPAKVAYIANKIKLSGYNVSYPITITKDGELVDGGHRIEACKEAGIFQIPYIVKPDDISSEYHAIRCNDDGADTEPYDVFDYAELCWTLNEVDKMTGDDIASRLGWGSKQKVDQYKTIKDTLHVAAWRIVRSLSTKNQPLVDGDEKSVVDQKSTTVDWKESHFRAFLKHLPCPNGDRNIMRHQLRALREIMDGKKITAATCEKSAQKHAWYATLSRLMNDGLVAEVGLRERVRLYKNIQNGVFGKEEADKNLEIFNRALTALNEDAMKVQLYHADTLRILPQLDDKSINLVVTDPPYNTTDHEWDQYGTSDQFIGWMQEWTTLLKPKLKDDYHLFIFCDPDYMADIEIMLKSNGWPIKSRIIWEYRNLVKGRDVTDKFIENYQVCFHCGSHALNWPDDWDDRRFMVQRHATPQTNFTEGRHHPTAKPLSLIKLMVELGSKPGDLVLDTFAGGGTTGEACKVVGQRRCMLIERDDHYCKAIEARLKIKRIEHE